MSTRSRIDQLNRSRVSAVKIVFASLVNSISDEELKRNLDLRNEIKKIPTSVHIDRRPKSKF